ncbi:MAG TPA: DUF465 domain-containing protein [Oligoflexia bacterium]|nr:DUF465 domain-containing protein [Oligoflexia bacterium]HMP47232.1 DUF465 domain-containing protein [Oligoflexia bacterium]
MSDNNHDLAHEFPEYKESIHQMKTSNVHFRKLFDKYHELNKKIHRSDIREDLLSDQEEEQLKKERLSIKDELYSMLRNSA